MQHNANSNSNIIAFNNNKDLSEYNNINNNNRTTVLPNSNKSELIVELKRLKDDLEL